MAKGAKPCRPYLATYFILDCDKGEFSTNIDIKNSDICQILRVGDRTIDRVRKKYIEEGYESVLERRVAPELHQKVVGNIEAKLVSLQCSEPFEGFSRWSLRFLANKMVELSYIDCLYGCIAKTVD